MPPNLPTNGRLAAKKRALLNIVKRKKLPLIYAGGEPLVDPAQCDEVLCAQAKYSR